VVDDVTRQIVQGVYPGGTPLPPEPELAAIFGVSRTVVREAVRLLASKGLVSVKHGSGVWVQPPDAWDHLDPLILASRLEIGQDISVLDQIIEARRIVEPEVAYLAARRRTSEHLSRLRDLLAAMRSALINGDIERIGELDFQFHETLFIASGNLVLRQLVWTLSTLFQVAATLFRGDAPRREDSQRDHAAILAAVEAGDAERARQTMRQHIDLAAADIRTELLARWSCTASRPDQTDPP
jgi:DNA-binding FadR family transcriptional regulator